MHRYGRNFDEFRSDDESCPISVSDEDPSTVTIQKGGREGMSECYRYMSHRVSVTLLLFALHIFFFVPAVASLAVGPTSYEYVYQLRNHFVCSLSLFAALYWILFIIFGCHEFYLNNHPRTSFDASRNLTMIYGCTGVHPRIVLLISLAISSGLLMTPLMANLPLNHSLTFGKIIENRFGSICPGNYLSTPSNLLSFLQEVPHYDG
eukprot:TRINITY_DN6677_c0_g1_i21.p1 TRINITY_DN6677_c0_g1~~TRINITY_DN6677_c0_g1_i21.p1  ORF type:complete len:206 (-),score=17.96 TRINITY_DN6677_c0_g1_i21:57-674(-)